MFDNVRIKNENRVTQTRTPAVNASFALKQEQSHFASKQDMAELSRDWQKRTDWSARAQDTLDQLQQSFPQINIMVSETLDDAALHSSISSLGSGTHLILSENFLHAMGANYEQYAKYKDILIRVLTNLSKESQKYDGTGVYITKDSKVTWHGTYERSALPTSQEHTSSLNHPSNPASKLFRSRISVSYKTGTSYARLAGASSKSQVRTVMGDVQQNITALRMTSIYGNDRERTKAKQAIASLNKLVLRGQQKLRRLDTEDIMKLRQKRAEQKEEQDKALCIKLELAKKRTQRRTADGALLQEGKLDDMGRDYYHRKYKAYEYDLPSTPVATPITPVIPSSGLIPSDITQAFTPSEVSVSMPLPL